MAALVILLANWVLLARLSVLVVVLAPSLFMSVLPMFLGGALGGLVIIYLAWRKLDGQAGAPRLEMKNPTEIRAALGFGVLYALVLFAAAWLSDLVGSRGVYAVALVSGLTDLDAITLQVCGSLTWATCKRTRLQLPCCWRCWPTRCSRAVWRW